MGSMAQVGYRKAPCFVSCRMGLKASRVHTSIFSDVPRGISITTCTWPLSLAAHTGMSCHGLAHAVRVFCRFKKWMRWLLPDPLTTGIFVG